jgi:hypothetical protein
VSQVGRTLGFEVSVQLLRSFAEESVNTVAPLSFRSLEQAFDASKASLLLTGVQNHFSLRPLQLCQRFQNQVFLLI